MAASGNIRRDRQHVVNIEANIQIEPPIMNLLEPIDLENEETDDCLTDWFETLSSLSGNNNDDYNDDSSDTASSNTSVNVNDNSEQILSAPREHSENVEATVQENPNSSISDELTCPICLDIVVQATTLVPCGHTICLSCIPCTSTVACNKECPVCRDAFTQTFPCRTVNNIIEAIIRTQSENSSSFTMDGFSVDDVQVYRDRCDTVERSRRAKAHEEKLAPKSSNKRRLRSWDYTHPHSTRQRNHDLQPRPVTQHVPLNFFPPVSTAPNIPTTFNSSTSVIGGTSTTHIGWTPVDGSTQSRGYTTSQQINYLSSYGSSADDAICIE
jgi:Zinc finger, C3HC4 type (RING finger)